MKKDEGLQWIREVRSEISREFQHDPRKIVEFYKKLDAKHKKLKKNEPQVSNK